MEVQLLLQDYIENSSEIKELTEQLQTKTESCVKSCTTPGQAQNCKRDLKHFKDYVKAYKEQFISKGEQICLSSIQGLEFTEKQEERRKCVEFYMKGAPVFQENVTEKLRSLLYRLDYSEL